MANNEFDKGVKFSFNDSINYNKQAIVSKHILKKDKGEKLEIATNKNPASSSQNLQDFQTKLTNQSFIFYLLFFDL